MDKFAAKTTSYSSCGRRVHSSLFKWTWRRFLLLFLVSCHLPTMVFASEILQGCEAAFQTKNYSLARSLCEVEARQGNNKASYLMAQMLLEGLGGEKNEQAALGWLKRPAMDGQIDAQVKLVGLYERGVNGKPEYKQALQWLLRAAQEGDGFAQGRLGLYYELGLEVKQNSQLARQWYEKAISNGDMR